MGISLPENFNSPYSKRSLTDFWNSWHITLAHWFRSYMFFPFTRFLRSQKHPLPIWVVILAGQLLTMVSIGLWHGITWNFFIWGAWHGMGLYVQNRWSEWLRPRLDSPKRSKTFSVVLQSSSWLATFLYVSLGWVWFALPSPILAFSFFSRLAGFSS
jgi:alginate O-acetyltransferase complex protein AlgI